jgi:hypothetical protein
LKKVKSKKRISRTVQPEQDIRNRTARLRFLGPRTGQDRKDRTSQSGQGILYMSDRTLCPEQDNYIE